MGAKIGEISMTGDRREHRPDGLVAMQVPSGGSDTPPGVDRESESEVFSTGNKEER